MRKRNGYTKKWIIKVRNNVGRNSLRATNGGELSFEQVGDNLIVTDLIESLLSQVEGKVIDQPFVISVPALLDDDFTCFYLDSQRAVMAECLAHLFNTQRIVIRPEE